MEYRIDRQGLLDRIAGWDSFLKRRVCLIACGGTALTLLGVKPSTKDIDLIVPDSGEYDYLINILKQLGYKPVSGSGWGREDGFIFDIFRGKKVHTTELLGSPIDKDNHILVKEFSHIYFGVLNYYDIIISKLFRGSSVDMDDCLALFKNKRNEIDLEYLKRRFRETASFDISSDKVNKNLDNFLEIIQREGLGNEK